MSGSDVLVYTGPGSPPCLRVMIALEEKGLTQYQQKELSFAQKEHKSEEILKMNKRGQLPITRFKDVVVNESLAAVDYIEVLYPNQGTRLHPSDPAILAKVLQRKHEALNLETKGIEHLIKPAFKLKQDLPQDKVQPFLDELSIWEGYLKQEGEGCFVAGDTFTMADVSVFPLLGSFYRMGFNWAPRYPNIDAYYKRMCQRASVQKTWPPHWKEEERLSVLANI